jgi:hypothetical protein
MGDTLDENFVLGAAAFSDDEKPTKTSQNPRKRKMREALSASSDSADGQRQIFQEALPDVNAENFRFFDKTSSSLLRDSNDDIRKIFADENSKILVITSSANRVTDLLASDDFATSSPLALQFHGTGRKQEQLQKMRKDIRSDNFKTIIGVSARIARFVEEEVINLASFHLIAIDISIDAKKFNTLSQRESKQALNDIFTSNASFIPAIVLF